MASAKMHEAVSLWRDMAQRKHRYRPTKDTPDEVAFWDTVWEMIPGKTDRQICEATRGKRWRSSLDCRKYD